MLQTKFGLFFRFLGTYFKCLKTHGFIETNRFFGRAHLNLKRLKLCQRIGLFSFNILNFLTRQKSIPLVFFALILKSSFGFAVQAEISKMGETLHIEFSGQKNWEYNLQKKELQNQTVFELDLPRLSPEASEQLIKWSDPYIKEIQIHQDSDKSTVRFFSKQKSLEAFDYLTEEPSRLIVDFFLPGQKKLGTEARQSEQVTNNKNNPRHSNTEIGDLSKNKNEIELATSTAEVDANGGKQKAGNAMRDPASDFLVISPEGQVKAESQTEQAGMAKENTSEDAKKIKDQTFKAMSGIFDGGDPDFERFAIPDYQIQKSSMIRSRYNLYIPFPMLLVERDFFSKLESERPIYESEYLPNNSDYKEYQLLYTLFKNRRFGIFIESLEKFLAKNPRSYYDANLRYMMADAFYERHKEFEKRVQELERDFNNTGDEKLKTEILNAQKLGRANFESAILKYREAVDRHPTSDWAKRAQLLIAFADFFDKKYFESLRSFQRFVRENENLSPKKPNTTADQLKRDHAALFVARSLLKLGRYDEALEEYKKIAQSSISPEIKTEAEFLMGDVAFSAKNFNQAVRFYQDALKNGDEAKNNFPNAFYNLAESHFWLGEYKKGLDAYREFLKRFPSHPHAGFAMARVGEVLDILGADETKVRGAFLETYFRYGQNKQGGAIARMRSLSRSMKEMKEKEKELAIGEIKKLASKNPDLQKIDLFSTVLIADGLNARRENIQAAEELIAWYRKNPTTTDLTILQNRIERFLNDEISQTVDRGEFLKALKVHGDYAHLWLKNSSRIDTPFNIAKAYEQSGSYHYADKLYQEVANRLYTINGTGESYEKSLFEKIPEIEEVRLRLSANKVKAGKWEQALEFLSEIKDPGRLSEAEQIERVELFAEVLTKMGDLQAGKVYLRDLIENFRGKPALMTKPALSLGQIQIEQKLYKDAAKTLRRAEAWLKEGELLDTELHFSVLEALGQALEGDGNRQELAQVWTELLNRYEQKFSVPRIRYKLGNIYFAKGDMKKASEIWEPLAKSPNSSWHQLAQEQLTNKEWNSDLKKYVQRIPAMSREQKDP